MPNRLDPPESYLARYGLAAWLLMQSYGYATNYKSVLDTDVLCDNITAP